MHSIRHWQLHEGGVKKIEEGESKITLLDCLTTFLRIVPERRYDRASIVCPDHV